MENMLGLKKKQGDYNRSIKLKSYYWCIVKNLYRKTIIMKLCCFAIFFYLKAVSNIYTEEVLSDYEGYLLDDFVLVSMHQFIDIPIKQRFCTL